MNLQEFKTTLPKSGLPLWQRWRIKITGWWFEMEMLNKLRRVLDGFKQLFYIDDRTDQEFANDMFESGEWKRDVEWESNPTKQGGYSNKIYPYRTKKQYDGRYYYSDKLD